MPFTLRRSTTDENLTMIFPGITPRQMSAMREAMWEHLLLMVCEIAHAPRKIQSHELERSFQVAAQATDAQDLDERTSDDSCHRALR